VRDALSQAVRESEIHISDDVRRALAEAIPALVKDETRLAYNRARGRIGD